MGHYRSDRRHAEFLLLDVLAADGAPEAFADFDAGTVRDVLAGAEEHAHSRLADSFAAGERQRPRLDPDSGRVLLPPDLRQALRDHLDSDWLRLDLPPERSGFHVPPSLRWAATEFVLGANPAVAMCTQLVPSAVRLLEEQGTPQQQRLAELVLERGWTVTMVLTEPEAGSDVGAARTRAVPQPDGSWHLEGSKRFITWASHDAAENVVHLVLARPQGVEGAGGPGTRGLSLFVVPEHLHDPETGEPGERNGVEVVSLEHKMGLAGSPTCELALGAGKPAVGHLLGDRHEGLRQMFEIITYVRMMVGAKAAAALSSGHLHAREYAEVRIQGRAPGAGPGAADIPIIDHPDVRRSLLTQRAYAEGSRALVLHTATQLDRIEAAAARGERDRAAEARHRLLLPIVKTWCAENAFRVLATESLQTLGGSGYTADHPLEQYVRDTKIDSIYEGTTGIQALDLLQRRLVPDETTIGALLADVAGTAAELEAHPDLGVEGGLLAEAAQAVRALVRLSVDAAGADPALAALGATRVLLAIGDLVVGWLLLRTARVAADLLAAGERGEEAANLRAYVASGRWFARQVLPRTGSDLTSAELLDRAPLELERSSV